MIEANTSLVPSLSESVAALFIASLKSESVVDEVAATEICDCPFDVKLCPPPAVGSADQVPKFIVIFL